MNRINALAFCSLLLGLNAALACGNGGGGGEAKDPVACGGEQRAQLDCTSEFKYDATNVEGGFSAIGLGSLEAKTEQKALRQIDQETERYVAQSRRLCDEYNKCVIDRETYSLRSENLRRRMNRVPELYEGLKAAADPEQKRKALAKAYEELVPDESRVELALSFSVLGRKPDQADTVPLSEGASLPTGSRVAFAIQVSRAAHVYLFQKSQSGEVNVLFPDPRITVQNPIAAGTELRIPQGGASFKLDEKDVGTERVFVVASLEPVTALSQAVAGLQSGSQPAAPLQKLTQIGSGSDCNTRALSFEEDQPAAGCTRQRGLSFESDDGGKSVGASASPASIRAKTEAADTLIARVFTFQHTP